MTDTPLPPELEDLHIPPDRPLVVVDVDEVLGLFVRGFEKFVGAHGLEMRIDRFALFQNVYRPGATSPIEVGEGKRLLDAFFACDPQDMDMAPGAADALAAIARHATVVILTNAPETSRSARARWLADHALAYPLVIGAGPKGRPVAALAARTPYPTAFIDDLMHNLDSVEREAPTVHRFQSVADERLRPFAPCAPDRHRRIDHWPHLGETIARSLNLFGG